MARITTVIPVYNGERFILDTLESLAKQTLPPDRVVVIDDCSKDRTEQIVRNFQKLNIDWRPNQRNLGLFPNHNNALNLAVETEFLHILHADDVILPTFFEKLVPLIEHASGFALAFGGHVFMREDGAPTQQKFTVASEFSRRLSLREFLGSLSELKAIQLHSAVMKTSRKPLPIRFHTDFPQVADVIFHAELAPLCSEIWAHPEILCHVRIHPNNVSNKNMLSLDAWVLDEWRAMQQVYSLMDKNGLGSWTRRKKLNLLFGARSRVKVKTVRQHDARYAKKIADVAKEKVGVLNYAAACGVVAVRDSFFPVVSSSAERLKTQNEP
jgi:glycosyltransferase involved in cell wall biosynthesis